MAFDAVVVFAKWPRPGKVKTRLASSIGKNEAARLYGLFLRYLSWRLRRLPPGVKLMIAVDPPGASSRMRGYFPYSRKPTVFPQKGRDLGARMLEATAEARRRGAQKVLLIGSDCLELGPAHLRQALHILEGGDLVLGPAADGGYYLVGWRRPRPGCFRGVVWGTSKVLAKTLGNARREGLKTGFLEALSDVDRAEDLPRLLRRLDRRNPATRGLREACSPGVSSRRRRPIR